MRTFEQFVLKEKQFPKDVVNNLTILLAKDLVKVLEDMNMWENENI